MQFDVAPREGSGIVLLAQTQGLWDLVEASGRSYQKALPTPCTPGIKFCLKNEAETCLFFPFYSFTAANAILSHLYNPLHFYIIPQQSKHI